MVLKIDFNSLFKKNTKLIMLVLFMVGQPATVSFAQQHQLNSWNQGENKSKILQYLANINDLESAHFVPVLDRVAVIDNDGTLWAEKPLYPQVAYLTTKIRDKYREVRKESNDPVINAVMNNDYSVFKGWSKQQQLEGLLKPLAGRTLSNYQSDALKFLQNSQHPKFDKPFSDMVYQPMLELVQLLQTYQFEVYIVTGGGEDFVRAISMALYGIPADNVIGTLTENSLDKTSNSVNKGYKLVNGINEEQHKVNRIKKIIGKKPIVAIGNSTGDLEMLSSTKQSSYNSLAILLRHDDAKREFAYSKGADKVQQLAQESDWLTVSMQHDFKKMFIFQ